MVFLVQTLQRMENSISGLPEYQNLQQQIQQKMETITDADRESVMTLLQELASCLKAWHGWEFTNILEEIHLRIKHLREAVQNQQYSYARSLWKLFLES